MQSAGAAGRTGALAPGPRDAAGDAPDNQAAPDGYSDPNTDPHHNADAASDGLGD
jgi:hypothetical protein